jgi:hypothetical protein
MSNTEKVSLNESRCTIKGSAKKIELGNDPGGFEEKKGEENDPRKVNERKFFPCLEEKL